MGELLGAAARINNEQNIEKVSQQKIIDELREAKLLGIKRAKEFFELMVKHEVPTEDLYRMTKNRAKPTFFTKRRFDYEFYGKGWVILGTSFDASDDCPAHKPGLMIMTDMTLRKWLTAYSGPEKGDIKVLHSTECIGLEKLGDNTYLGHLGQAIANAGIV